MNMFAILRFMLVVTMVAFMHRFPALSIPYRMISGRQSVRLPDLEVLAQNHFFRIPARNPEMKRRIYLFAKTTRPRSFLAG
jgi:hypothetical protein